MKKKTLKKKKKQDITCIICMCPVHEDIAHCAKCDEPAHSSCINDFCANCESEMYEAGFDLDSIPSSDNDEFSQVGDELDEVEVDEMELEDEHVDEMEQLWSSEDSSVYEEPSQESSEEDIMVEIVRDRLLNGWTSEEEEVDDDLEFEEFFDTQEDTNLVVEVDSQTPVEEVVQEGEGVAPEEVKEEEIVEEVVAKEPITPKIVKVEEKKPIQSTLFNSKADKTPKPKATSTVNPWLALAAMNKNSSLARPFPGSIVELPIHNFISVNTNPNFRNDRSKLDLQARIRAAAQAVGGNNRDRSITKAVKELGKLLSQDDDGDFVLLEDIVDEELIDTATSPVSENANDPLERFKRVPLGTFWNSQRSKSKVSKKRDIQYAVKRASENKLLESTLLETLPKRNVFASPMLVAFDTSITSTSIPSEDEEIPSWLIPPPLNLN